MTTAGDMLVRALSMSHHTDSRSIFRDAIALEKSGHWGTAETERIIGIVCHIDVTQAYIGDYFRVHQLEGPLPFDFVRGLEDLCSVAKKTLNGGLGRIEMAYRATRVAVEGPSAGAVATEALFRDVGAIAEATHNMAKATGIIAGAAVLAFATYAIWHSTQDTSTTKYFS